MVNQNKIKHLEMIENIVDRMAKNSLQLKTWTMALVVLIGGLAANDMDRRFVIIAFIPIICFWLLDTYYLQIERKYRILYRSIVKKKEDEIDFSMDLSQISDMSINESNKICFLDCMFSFTELVFYLPIAIVLVVLTHILDIF